MKQLCCSAAVVCVAALATACDQEFCGDGEFPGTIIVQEDEWMIPGSYGIISNKEAQHFPVADGSPFTACRVIGALVIRGAVGEIDGDRDYPAVEELGQIGVDVEFFDDGGDERAIDDLVGFDDVVRLNGISGSIGQISGFNGIEVVEGSLTTRAHLTGFTALREVTGTLDVGTLDGVRQLVRVGGDLRLDSAFEEVGLSLLEEVGADLVFDQSSIATVRLPALRHVGGELLVHGNRQMTIWETATNVVIDDKFTASVNGPINNAEFTRWIDESRPTIGGRVKICINGTNEEIQGETCNE
jgi:hypothetical protein